MSDTQVQVGDVVVATKEIEDSGRVIATPGDPGKVLSTPLDGYPVVFWARTCVVGDAAPSELELVKPAR